MQPCLKCGRFHAGDCASPQSDSYLVRNPAPDAAPPAGVTGLGGSFTITRVATQPPPQPAPSAPAGAIDEPLSPIDRLRMWRSLDPKDVDFWIDELELSAPPVTEDMVERAYRTFFSYAGRDDVGDKEAMRAALKAALGDG